MTYYPTTTATTTATTATTATISNMYTQESGLPTPISQEDQFTLAQILNTPLSDDASPLLKDWLILPQDHLLKDSTDTSFQDLFQLLPISPPLTASPTTTENENDMISTEALVSLFPDIMMNTNTTELSSPPMSTSIHTTSVSQQQQQQQSQTRRVVPKPVAILPKPKTATTTTTTTTTPIPIAIAPRPASMVTSSQLPSPLKRKINETDEAALKRQKNTDAARRSRLKKLIKMENLEKQVSELEGDNARLTTRVAVLESEKGALIEKDKTLEERIRTLEAQLAEAHRALTAKCKD